MYHVINNYLLSFIIFIAVVVSLFFEELTQLEEEDARMQQDRRAVLMRAVSLTSYGSEEGFIFLKSVRIILNFAHIAENVALLVQQPRPEIEEAEVLVKVKCCAITDQDRAVLKGAYTELTRSPPPDLPESTRFTISSIRLPMVLGYAISGIVEEVGMEVQRFKVGDEVIGKPIFSLILEILTFCFRLGIAPLHVGGGYAEYAVFGHHDLGTVVDLLM